MASKQKRHEK